MAALWKTPTYLEREFRQILKDNENKKEILDETINLSNISLLPESKSREIFDGICKEDLNAAILIAQRDVKEQNEHFRLFSKELEYDTASTSCSSHSSSVEVFRTKSKEKLTQRIRGYPATSKRLPARDSSPPTQDGGRHTDTEAHTFTQTNRQEVSSHVSGISNLITKMKQLAACKHNKHQEEEEVDEDRRRRVRLAGRASRLKRSLYDLQRGFRDALTLSTRPQCNQHAINKRLLLLYRGVHQLMRQLLLQMIDMSDPAHFFKGAIFAQVAKLLRQLTESSSSLHLHPIPDLSSMLTSEPGRRSTKQWSTHPSLQSLLDENNNTIEYQYKNILPNCTPPASDGDDDDVVGYGGGYGVGGGGGVGGGEGREMERNKMLVLSRYVRQMRKESLGVMGVGGGGGGGGRRDVVVGVERVREVGVGSGRDEEGGGGGRVGVIMGQRGRARLKIRMNANHLRLQQLNALKHPSLKRPHLTSGDDDDDGYDTIKTFGHHKRPTSSPPTNRTAARKTPTNKKPPRGRSKDALTDMNRTKSINKIPLRSMAKKSGQVSKLGHDDHSGKVPASGPVCFEAENIYLTQDDDDEEDEDDDDDDDTSGNDNDLLDILGRMQEIEAERKSITSKWLGGADNHTTTTSTSTFGMATPYALTAGMGGGGDVGGLIGRWEERDKEFFKGAGSSKNEQTDGDDNDEDAVGGGADDDAWRARVYESYLQGHWGSLRGVLGRRADPLALCAVVTDDILDDVIKDVCSEVETLGQDFVNSVYQSEFISKNDNQ